MKKVLKLIFLIIIILNICGCLKKEEKEIEKPIPSLVTKVTKEEGKILTWIDNEYTKTIPKFVDGEKQEVYPDQDGFVFGAFEVTEEEYSNYLIAVKKYGYNKKAIEVTSDYKVFTAINGQYQLVIGYSDGYMTITITKEVI